MSSEAARALARKRWRGVSKEERSRAASEAVKARWAKIPPEERSRMAKRIRAGKSPLTPA